MKITKKNIYQILIVIAIFAIVIASVYTVVNGRHYFTNHNLRQIGTELRNYGIWSPIVIFLLILTSALIPPLPLPISFLEISSGIIFGFWPGILLAWFSQIISFIACFLLSQKIGKIFIGKIVNLPIFNFYKQYIEKKGALAIFVFRATLSSPFNISYFAGLIKMNGWKFFIASALGVIPEVVLFVFLGTLIDEHVRFRLWYIFLFLLVLTYLPNLILISINYLKNHKKNEKH
jgi:uncharacterized membrane protein YdjX (TVP38/TMEM64 family)